MQEGNKQKSNKNSFKQPVCYKSFVLNLTHFLESHVLAQIFFSLILLSHTSLNMCGPCSFIRSSIEKEKVADVH